MRESATGGTRRTKFFLNLGWSKSPESILKRKDKKNQDVLFQHGPSVRRMHLAKYDRGRKKTRRTED